jgi:hypothetical protein
MCDACDGDMISCGDIAADFKNIFPFYLVDGKGGFCDFI